MKIYNAITNYRTLIYILLMSMVMSSKEIFANGSFGTSVCEDYCSNSVIHNEIGSLGGGFMSVANDCIGCYDALGKSCIKLCQQLCDLRCLDTSRYAGNIFATSTGGITTTHSVVMECCKHKPLLHMNLL